MSDEKKMFPFDVCFQCMQNEHNDVKSNIFSSEHRTISITNPNFLFIPKCRHWSLQGKRSGGKWGPKLGCNYVLEHTVVEKKKFAITNIKDLQWVHDGINSGSCVFSFNDMNFDITMFAGKTLQDLNKVTLQNIYHKLVWYFERNIEDRTLGKIYIFDRRMKEYKETEFSKEFSEEVLIKLIKQGSLKDFFTLKRMLKNKYPFTVDKFNKWNKKKEKANVIS